MRFEKNNNVELIRFQFTDDTRQTLESVTVFLKDRFAEYGYLPETDVIPIEWLSAKVKQHLEQESYQTASAFQWIIDMWHTEKEDWEVENGRG